MAGTLCELMMLRARVARLEEELRALKNATYRGDRL